MMPTIPGMMPGPAQMPARPAKKKQENKGKPSPAKKAASKKGGNPFPPKKKR